MSQHADIIDDIARKSRGAFYTPKPLCDYVVAWAIREPSDVVLEPSCGDANFLLSCAERLKSLGSPMDDSAVQLVGYELDYPSVARARSRLLDQDVSSEIRVGDFFDVEAEPLFDAVVGNPPYVRFQAFAGENRSKSREAALRAGVPISQLASSWAAFTVHATQFLRPGGRLGLVLPGELLTVNYASAVRKFLLEQFSAVNLVTFTERVFPGVLEEVVLLMAEGFGSGPVSHFDLFQATNSNDLNSIAPKSWSPVTPGGKWTASYLEPDVDSLIARTDDSPAFVQLGSMGSTKLGMVTGKNSFFALTSEKATGLGLARADLIKLSPPGSSHLRTFTFTEAAWEGLRKAGKQVWLFRPSDSPSASALAYIQQGENDGVHEAYKCRVRKPWWRVPLVEPADMLLTYMNADIPRLTRNEARVFHLNSVHGFYLYPHARKVASATLSIGMLNSLTLLAMETKGRSYGGGVLKIEPGEAITVPVPALAALDASATPLRNIASQVARYTRLGKLAKAIELVDRVVLEESGLMNSEESAKLRLALHQLQTRRVTRGKPADG